MKLIKRNLEDFISRVSSGEPTPGGGSVSSLVGALGCALGEMVGRLTIPSEKYMENLSMREKLDYEIKFMVLESVGFQLKDLMDEDTNAYKAVINAYRSPKDTEEKREKRAIKIQESLKGAIQPPLKIARLSYKALEAIDVMVEGSKKNAITDMGVGCLLLTSAIKGAILNVKINLSSIKDESLVKEVKAEVEEIWRNTEEKSESIMKRVESFI